MILTRMLKNALRKLDQYSPYPLLYTINMSENEKTVFDRALKKSSVYLEFGMGGSTLRAIQKSKVKIYTVESSPEWITAMREYIIIRYFENKRLFIFPVHIGQTRAWGYPETDDNRNFPAYSSNVFKFVDKAAIDLVFVDGRFRVACALKTILECHMNDSLELLFHDFWNREKYRVVLKYLDTLDRADTLGAFSIKKNIELESARNDYEAYKFDPS